MKGQPGPVGRRHASMRLTEQDDHSHLCQGRSSSDSGKARPGGLFRVTMLLAQEGTAVRNRRNNDRLSDVII
jgi:hypothetical protein